MSPFPARNLDLLRATAVMFVVCAHFFGSNGQPGGTVRMHMLGLLGVLIFFVHTSLVLILSLERMDADSAGSTSPYWSKIAGKFYLRRLFRIYPLSIFLVVAVTLLKIPSNIFTQYQPLSSIQLAANLALMQNLMPKPCNASSPLWSLPWEVQMYLVLPLLFLVAQRGRLRFLAGITLAIMTIDIGGVLLGIQAAHLLDYAPCFMGGILAFMLIRRKSQPALLGAWLWPLSLSGVALFLVLSGLHWSDHKVIYWAICSTVGLLIPRFHDLPVSWITRAAHQIAQYSYGIYLFHGPALWLSFDKLRGIGWALSTLLFIGLTAAFSVLAYHALEHPLIQLGKALTIRSERAEVSARSEISSPDSQTVLPNSVREERSHAGA